MREGWAPGSWEEGIKGLEGQGKDEGLVLVLERGGERKEAAGDSLVPAPDTQSGAEGPRTDLLLRGPNNAQHRLPSARLVRESCALGPVWGTGSP